jgi:uncharacterized protein YndB with AHSA1/START domain
MSDRSARQATAVDQGHAARRQVSLVRLIDTPRQLVFSAWTDADHLAQWWGPKGFTNPVCEVDMRPGGAIRIVMRAPDGVDYPMRGSFREVVWPERLVLTAVAEDKGGRALIESLTTVTFASEGERTRLAVHASAVSQVAEGARMLEGMEVGWTQSLERLDDYIVKA